MTPQDPLSSTANTGLQKMVTVQDEVRLSAVLTPIDDTRNRAHQLITSPSCALINGGRWSLCPAVLTFLSCFNLRSQAIRRWLPWMFPAVLSSRNLHPDTKNPAMAYGGGCMRFYREIDQQTQSSCLSHDDCELGKGDAVIQGWYQWGLVDFGANCIPDSWTRHCTVLVRLQDTTVNLC